MPLQRFSAPNSASPVSRAIRISGEHEMIMFGAQYPAIIDDKADPRSVRAFGDTATQTSTTLARVEAALEEAGLTLSNLVSMRVYLVGDPVLSGEMDFDGFNGACKTFFGSRRDCYPVRTTLKVAGLANPGWLIEIEVIAAR
jgi:enamine deaminase RidA (YjgF/YER057c/UK114 family)